MYWAQNGQLNKEKRSRVENSKIKSKQANRRTAKKGLIAPPIPTSVLYFERARILRRYHFAIALCVIVFGLENGDLKLTAILS